MKSVVKRLLGPRTVEALRIVKAHRNGAPLWPPDNLYEVLYEHHGRHAATDSDAVGVGPWDLIGRSELALLQEAGLRPDSTLLDFGCGTGRLAVHAVPALSSGHYIGLDVSQEMLRRLRIQLDALPGATGRVSIVHQPADVFPFEADSVDMLCAFSVFTHIEHEDTYRYLVDARRVVRPGGRLVFSCLALPNADAERIFLASASVTVKDRWSNVRCVVTGRDLITEIARLAGWTMVRWYPGDEANVRVPGLDEPVAFGQSVGVLE